MAYHNVVFPTNISYTSSGGPRFLTEVIVLGSGHTQRNIEWENAKCEFNIVWGNHLNEQIKDLLNFMRARRGMAHSFPMRDWSDYEGDGELIGTGDDTETDFQLIKTYDSGCGDDYIRTITKPEPDTVKIYFDGAEQVSGWSIDYLTGIVTFSSAPHDGVEITADYRFYVPCCFDTDYLPISIDIRNIHTMPNISIVEERE